MPLSGSLFNHLHFSLTVLSKAYEREPDLLLLPSEFPDDGILLSALDDFDAFHCFKCFDCFDCRRFAVDGDTSDGQSAGEVNSRNSEATDDRTDLLSTAVMFT